MEKKINISVLVSGGGTNLQALIDAVRDGGLPDTAVALVISSREDAFALERAERAGIKGIVLAEKDFSDEAALAAALNQALEAEKTDWVVLAGYTRVLHPDVVKRYAGRVINVHPSLIPKYCGRGFYGERVHEAVLAGGETVTGATVHFVDEGIDTGQVLSRREVPVEAGDDVQTLSARVLAAEHEILVEAVRTLCEWQLDFTRSDGAKTSRRTRSIKRIDPDDEAAAGETAAPKIEATTVEAAAPDSETISDETADEAIEPERETAAGETAAPKIEATTVEAAAPDSEAISDEVASDTTEPESGAAPDDKKAADEKRPRKGRIAARFRGINIALFALALLLIALALSAVFTGIIRQLSEEYALRYATSSADALSAHVDRGVGLMAKAARSGAVTEWFADEGNEDKKNLAYEELTGIVGELYSNNLYAGLEGTLHEYSVEETYEPGNIWPFAVLDRGAPEDAWYFECVESDYAYLLKVAVDHVLQKKRVWLDYKVTRDGAPLGAISTGLDFSHVAEELFSQYDDKSTRGLIIDENGVIYIDSDLLDDDAFLRDTFEVRIEEEISDPAFLAALRSRLDQRESYSKAGGEPAVVRLSTGPYRYATIAPVKHTNWSSVILYDPAASLNMSRFIPVFTITLILLLAFAFATNVAGHRLIFSPLAKLIRSLERLKENKEEQIYGIGRDDELGELSDTIQDLFIKANYDALTGIYNRRHMENNMEQILAFLSRANGVLSVLMVDIDYFKYYNDTYGHEQGDVCLKRVARALANGATRINDFAARYGGEEFIVVLPDSNEAGARLVAEKLIENARALNIPHEKNTIAPCVTVSIGVTTGRVDPTRSRDDFVKRADEALYLSKQNGRNRYTYLALD